MINVNIAIVGSGISGLSISKMLQKNFKTITLEKTDNIGGLIKCSRVNGNLFHKVGGHIFNSKNAAVLDWFWNHFDKDNEFIAAKRNAKILLREKFVGYPIENFIYQLTETEIHAIVSELLESQAKEHLAPSNFKAFLLSKFGKTLYDIYFGPYNKKIWDVELSKVPLEWLEGKLPMPNITEIFKSNILKKEESTMVHSSFFYPKNDGSQFIVNRLAAGLNIQTASPLVTVGLLTNNKLLINKSITTDYIVFTGDVRTLENILNIEDAALHTALIDVRDLKANGTSNVLCETDKNDISWLYLPESKYKAHRIIYTGNFSASNSSVENNRSTCVVEFSGKHDHEAMLEELRKLPGNLIPIDFNYEANSYIIHDMETKHKIQVLKNCLKKYNIYLLGRFAEWEYYNMDVCIEKSMELANYINVHSIKIAGK